MPIHQETGEPPAMVINSRREGAVDVIELDGRLDLTGAEDAERFFLDYRLTLRDAALVIVSMREVDYISSSGLRVLIAAFKDIQKKGGQMALSDMNVAVEEVFRFAGLYDAFFRIFPTTAQALAHLQGLE